MENVALSDFKKNIKNKKIGLYQNEEFNITRERMVLWL